MKYIELVKGLFTSEHEARSKQLDPYVAYSIEANRLMFTIAPEPYVGPADNEIWYTSSDGNVIQPSISLPEGIIVSNTYLDGKGIMKFAGVISEWSALFFGCTTLTSIVMPNSVTIINGQSFYGCTALTSVTIPNSVTSIGVQAFDGCSSLTSITIPNSVANIEDNAFSDCTSLASIIIPDSVTSIGGYAFSNCTALTSVVIGANVSSSYATSTEAWFYNCPNIESIVVDEKNTIYDSRDNCNAIVKTDSNSLVLGCKSTKIVDTIEYVSTDSFKGITMDYLYVGKSANTINSWPEVTNMYFCSTNYNYGGASSDVTTTLVTCTFEEGVTDIPRFLNCANLNEVYIPKSIIKIPMRCFYGTNQLKKVYYAGTIEDWCNMSFSNNYLLGNLYINNQLVENLLIPNTVTAIGANTFRRCPSIILVTFHNTITSIEDNSFSDCSNLQTINYEGTVELWGLITLGTNWNLNVPATYVQCSDGQVTL